MCNHSRVEVKSDDKTYDDGLYTFQLGFADCKDCPQRNMRVIQYKCKVFFKWRSWEFVDKRTCNHSVYNVLSERKERSFPDDGSYFAEFFVNKWLYRKVRCIKCEHEFGLTAKYKTEWQNQEQIAIPTSSWKRVK
jgi:hypothetical protein